MDKLSVKSNRNILINDKPSQFIQSNLGSYNIHFFHRWDKYNSIDESSDHPCKLVMSNSSHKNC